jgi:hypothetical protein
MEADMRRDLLTSLRRLSDAELIARVKSLAARERRATALLIAHLAELDTRDVHLRAGYSSLFAYCRDVLALSEHESYNRIEVARAARRFPGILEMLAAGSVNLTTVRLLGPHLTPENHRSVLESARGKRKAEVEEIVARLSPRPEVAATVRKLPESTLERKPASSPPTTLETVVQPAPVAPAGPAVPAPPALLLPRQGSCGEVTPLSPDRYKLRLTIGGSTLEKLRLARDMLRHVIPSGDDEAVLDRALTVLLADLARKKFAAAERPRPSRAAAPGARYIPAEVRRAAWLRDLGRCAFVGTNDRRCSERGFVEFHHLRPYAEGGEASVENIQLRCRRHNDYEARLYFAHRRGGGGGGLVREQVAPYGLGAFQAHGVELVPERVRAPKATAGPIRIAETEEDAAQNRGDRRFEASTGRIPPDLVASPLGRWPITSSACSIRVRVRRPRSTTGE